MTLINYLALMLNSPSVNMGGDGSALDGALLPPPIDSDAELLREAPELLVGRVVAQGSCFRDVQKLT